MAKQIPVAHRASQIEYAIRDVVVPAIALEAQGHKILKLNIGDPLAYPGLPTPDHMIESYQRALSDQKNGYSPSYGITDLRQAIAENEQSKLNGGWNCDPDNVYICHGVTEALQIIFATYLNEGDEVLAPGPHYPPYMAYPQVYGGKTVEYRLDPDQGWSIDVEDLKSKMNSRVKLLVLINPNNPTGNVITKYELDQVIELASQYEDCTIISDEIYDRLNFNGDHLSTASRSNNVPVITLNGVSKVYYAPGWRIGYMSLHDPLKRCNELKDGLERLLRSRLCASTPAQYGYLAGLKGGDEWMEEYLKSIIARNNLCTKRINEIEGLSVQKPQGAFYMFVKLTDPYWFENDKKFVIDLLHNKYVLAVHGSGFSQTYGKGHFRIVFLPSESVLEDALDRIAEFISETAH
ncbi:MAG: alanine aminotransferase [Candidatus Marinimicrobia bacterium]|nr:alanine aminotransferase [Candidatus Neomarinimicrobiota bacterium]